MPTVADVIKYTVEGVFTNLTQWTVVNKTKNVAVPVSVLYSEVSGNNTNIWLSYRADTNWSVNDVLVIMRCYIPIKYQLEMFYVDQREISFHRLPSKIRIGFGGKKGRMAVGIEHVKRTIQFYQGITSAGIVGKEINWAYSDKMIVQSYTQINEDNADFDLQIRSVAGSLAAGIYHFRMTAVLDGFNEILVFETSVTTTTASKFFPIPYIRTGSLSRRLTSVKVYFAADNLTGEPAYYFFKEYILTKDNAVIDTQDWTMLPYNWIYFSQSLSTGVDIYTETSSARVTTDNAIGSWNPLPIATDPNVWSQVLVTGSVGAYFLTLKFIGNVNLPNIPIMTLELPQTGLTTLIKASKIYTCTLTFNGNRTGNLNIGFRDTEDTTKPIITQASFPVTVASQTVTFELTAPSLILTGQKIYIDFNYVISAAYFVVNDTLNITGFTIKEMQDNYIDAMPTGALDITAMGYTPTFNIVRDWQSGVIINGQTFVGNAFVEKSYKNLIFFSPIASSGANEYDVLIASKFLDSDKDNFRGEAIIGLTVLLTLEILALTEGGGVVIDPTTGQTREVARGHGIMTKETIQKFRETIYWGTGEDIVKIAASSGYQAIIISDDSIRGIYNRIADKTFVVSCIDRFGTYHLAFQITESPKELLFTDRGWSDQSRDNHPTIMRNGFMNIVWFMDVYGNIYSIPQNVQEQIGYGDVYGRGESGW